MDAVRPVFVEDMPKSLQEGVLYVSRKYRTASHRCCCGCGTKVVTPLRKTEHRLEERGGLVSLYPSIGNWNYPCQSHYWIRDNQVVWAERWTNAQIQRAGEFDDAAKEAYFARVAWPWWRRALGTIGRWLASR